jgi:hypothetical protein
MPLIQGAIVMWSGTIQDIPTGWALCDGSNGTLDLRNRFIIGAGSTYSVGVTGGSADAVNVSHNHTISNSTTGSTSQAHTHSMPLYNYNPSGSINLDNGRTTGDSAQNLVFNSVGPNHTHGISMSTVGESGVNKNLPPYYALAYIQQIV